jgi:hypothetical protein
MLPKRRFWKDEQKMKCGFSKHISRAILSLPNEDFGRMNKR